MYSYGITIISKSKCSESATYKAVVESEYLI